MRCKQTNGSSTDNKGMICMDLLLLIAKGPVAEVFEVGASEQAKEAKKCAGGWWRSKEQTTGFVDPSNLFYRYLEVLHSGCGTWHLIPMLFFQLWYGSVFSFLIEHLIW